jgi:two-component system, chemotaxis family, protein-glutamate methylesterase/glutaminase
VIRILVADDSIVFRRLMTDVADSFEGCKVVGQAHNGRAALQKITELNPDILTLDMEMPEMDGLQVLDALRKMQKPPAVIVVSALTERGGELTLKALQRGAFDFITKPQTGSMDAARSELATAMQPRIKALSLRYNVRDILRKPAGVTGESGTHTTADSRVFSGRETTAMGTLTNPMGASGGEILHSGASTSSTESRYPTSSKTASETVADPLQTTSTNRVEATHQGVTHGKSGVLPRPAIKPELIVIGVSTGGPNALSLLIPALPGSLGVPVFIVQHMPPLFTRSLADSLDKKSALMVTEAEHNSIAVPNTVYIAPGGKHMRIRSTVTGGITIQITDDAPENNCRPSVDYLFRSVSQHFPGRALSVVLTGMGSDGMLGVRLLKRTGCVSLVQDEASCVVYGMPRAVADAGLADDILPLERIAESIIRIIGK